MYIYAYVLNKYVTKLWSLNFNIGRNLFLNMHYLLARRPAQCSTLGKHWASSISTSAFIYFPWRSLDHSSWQEVSPLPLYNIGSWNFFMFLVVSASNHKQTENAKFMSDHNQQGPVIMTGKKNGIFFLSRAYASTKKAQILMNQTRTVFFPSMSWLLWETSGSHHKGYTGISISKLRKSSNSRRRKNLN